MSNVTKLPTGAPSHYEVSKAGRYFDVVLVTPCTGKNLQTALNRFADREAATQFGRDTAARMQRPFKARGVAP